MPVTAINKLNILLSGTTELTEKEVIGLGAVLAIFGVGLFIFAAAWYILLVVAQWKIFTKAGEPGWKCLIPVYNLYIQYKISWGGMYFWITFALYFVAGLFQGFAQANANNILNIISLVIYLVALVITIIATHKLSVSFGHGVGFTLGLIFLSTIFTLILAFGSSEYVGPNGEEAGSGNDYY